MPLTTLPVAHTEMLIRRPVADVFRAFVDPGVTSKFWFSSGSDVLAPDKSVTWYWAWYGVSANVTVRAFEQEHRILIAWPTAVEWIFSPQGPHATFVQITESGFTGSDDEQVAQAIDSMGGFSFVLAGCKAYLEHGIELNLVADHNPDHHVKK